MNEHVLRMEDRIPKALIKDNSRVKINVGRPRKSWGDQLKPG